jgi:hypothetical protein
MLPFVFFALSATRVPLGVIASNCFSSLPWEMLA